MTLTNKMRRWLEVSTVGFGLLAFGILGNGCVATAPVTFAWRSNTSQQYATTEGRTTKAADSNTVNADRTNELQNAVSTSSGSAATGEQTASLLKDAPEVAPADTAKPETADTAAPETAGTAASKSAGTAASKSADTAASKSADTATAKSADTAAPETADTATKQPVDTATNQPVDTVIKQPADTATGKSADNSAPTEKEETK